MGTVTPSVAGGNWSTTAAWTGSVVPTAADDVVFHAGAGNITIDGTSGSPSLCRSLDCSTFAYAGTLAQGASAQLNVGDGTTGVFLLVAGMTYVPNLTSLVKFVSTSGGVCNITTAAKRMGPMTFDGVGGKWQFQDACNNIAGATITLTNGALDTNSQAVAASSGVNFSSNNSNTRSLTLGTTTWRFAAVGTTMWDIGTATGMTLSAASSTLSQTILSSQVSIFAGGGLTYGTYTENALTTGSVTFTGANTFGTFTLSSSSGTKDSNAGYFLSANQTISGTFTITGLNTTTRGYIASNIRGTSRTINAATVGTCTQTDFMDITGAGAGSWNLSSITGGAGDCGGNSGITFNTPKNCYMKTAVSVNWSASNWYTASGGSTPISPIVPLPQDTAIFDANSVTAGSKTITLDVFRIPVTNFTGVLNTPAFASGSNAFELYGSLTLVSGMTHTGTGVMTYAGRASSTLNGGTLTWPTSSTIKSDSFSGTLTLAAALTSNAGLTMTSGTFALGGFNLSITALNANGGTVSGTGIITTTTAFTVAGGTVTLGGNPVLTGITPIISSGTLNLGTNAFNGATAYTLTGGTVGHSGDAVAFGGITLHYNGAGGASSMFFSGANLEGV